MIRLNKSQKGFTILELMIATVVFSVLLLGAATMLVQIGRLYYKGVVTSRTQETVRGISDEVSRAIQFSSNNFEVSGTTLPVQNTAGDTVTVQAFCIGNNRYSYIINGQVNSSGTYSTYEPGDKQQNWVPRALWRDARPETCAPLDITQTNLASDGKEMLGEGMRLFRLDPPQEIDANAGLVTFRVGVAYGADNELLDLDTPNTATCVGSGLGSQWCATSELNTTLFRRIR